LEIKAIRSGPTGNAAACGFYFEDAGGCGTKPGTGGYMGGYIGPLSKKPADSRLFIFTWGEWGSNPTWES
jgi:hypothetical protein